MIRDNYMVSAGDILSKYGTTEDLSKRISHGMLLSCFVELTSGLVMFELNERPIPVQMFAPLSVQLYPAICVLPTCREPAQFEFEYSNTGSPIHSLVIPACCANLPAVVTAAAAKLGFLILFIAALMRSSIINLFRISNTHFII